VNTTENQNLFHYRHHHYTPLSAVSLREKQKSKILTAPSVARSLVESDAIVTEHGGTRANSVFFITARSNESSVSREKQTIQNYYLLPEEEFLLLSQH
jgi:hypothetical protein